MSIDSEKLKRNRLIDARRVLGGIGACAIFFMASPTSPASAASDGPHQYPIAFTGEYGGVYPRENTDLTSEKIGEVLAEGNIVSIACEYDGQEVSNSLGTSSQVWEKLDNGTSIPNAFVNSRVFEPNPASDPDILFAMGAFGVDRISPGCYKIVNSYDFKPDKLVNAAMYKKEYQDELDGKVKSFEMRASNCE